jgi:CRP-like cAMP-binding protein
MSTGALGRVFEDGEVIVRQGDIGDCMYVIQEGKVGVYLETDGEEVLLAEPGVGEMIGEMAIFERQPRSATVKAHGQTRILTVDKRNFLRRVQEDPSIAFRILETMSHRIRDLNLEIGKLRNAAAEPSTVR